jgi:uncharacterized membrane protein YeaQ/YmgE (transglycosylase-associated protein family)
MAVGSTLAWLSTASIAGFLASFIATRSYGFGIIGNILVGILGSYVGDAIAPLLGLSPAGNPAVGLLSATAGALLALFLIGAGMFALLFLLGLLWRMEAFSRL